MTNLLFYFITYSVNLSQLIYPQHIAPVRRLANVPQIALCILSSSPKTRVPQRLSLFSARNESETCHKPSIKCM